MADAGVLPKPIDTKPVKAKPLTLGQATARVDEATNASEQANLQTADNITKLIADHHSEMESLMKQAPKPPGEEDKFKAPEQVNPVSAFGSSAGLLATLLGAFSRAPLTTSLKAMTAGMQAIQQGNAEAYTRAHDEWKENTDYAFKVLDAENKHYDRLIDFAKTDYDAALQGIQATAKARNDNVILEAARQKGLEGVEQINNERARLGMEMKTNASKMIPGEIFNQSLKEFVQTNHRQPTAQEMSQLWQQTQMMAATASIDAEDAKSMADQYLAGDKSVLQGMGYGNTGAANRALVQHYIREEARQRGMSGAQIATKIAEFGGLQAAERAVGTRSANVELAVSELNRVLPLALQASKTVNRGRFVPLTTAEQAVQRGSSDPNLAKFVAANNTLVNVYARAVSPTGVGTVEQREHAREMLSTATSQEAYEAVVGQMQKEAEAAEQAPGDVKIGLENLAGVGKDNAQKPPEKSSDVYLTETQQDYDMLDPGSKYRMPNDPPGKYRVK